MNQQTKGNSGFSLIELLVAIAIIALLTGIIVTNISTSRGKSRDAKRISDIGQIQLGLELYFDRCKEYPQTLDPVEDCTVSGTVVQLKEYITKIPERPEGGSYDYIVKSGLNDYFLHTTLEYPNSVVRDGMASVPAWYSGGLVTCSDTATSVDYCLSSK